MTTLAESPALFVDAGAEFDDLRVYRYRLWHTGVGPDDSPVRAVLGGFAGYC